MSSVPALLEPPRGLALNAFSVTCPGLHRVVRIPRPANREERRRIEQEIGHGLFQKADFAYAASNAPITDAVTVDIECDFDRNLHLYDLRTWISEQASSEKLRPRFAFGGEIQITGLSGDIEIDGLRVERRLRLRVTETDLVDRETWIVARHDTRYLVAGTLTDPQTQERAVGETAERIAGSGPFRGEVLNASNKGLTLRIGGKETGVESSNYTLTVRSSYVRRNYNTATLVKLQAASGSLTATGKRNRYAVKDRYKALAGAMDQLGWTIAMPDDRQAVIDRAWTEIRIQGGEA